MKKQQQQTNKQLNKTVLQADGPSWYGWSIKPFLFQEKKKYPIRDHSQCPFLTSVCERSRNTKISKEKKKKIFFFQKKTRNGKTYFHFGQNVTDLTRFWKDLKQ